MTKHPPTLFDTHCHIHEAEQHTTPVYEKWHAKGAVDAEAMLRAAREVGVERILCVGTTQADSQLAIEFARKHENMWASIGIHPHEAAEHLAHGRTLPQFAALAKDPKADKVVAVGECGLDYFYNHSPREAQIKVLRFQIELALAADLPMIFHVREAFDDFWPIFESYEGVRGVLHSFTDSRANLEKAVEHGLHLGVNGIATFAKDPGQRAMYKAIPLEKLLLETDAPFLTPHPFRGTICEPKHVAITAEFLSDLRGEPLELLATTTTQNATRLFGV